MQKKHEQSELKNVSSPVHRDLISENIAWALYEGRLAIHYSHTGIVAVERIELWNSPVTQNRTGPASSG